MKPHSALIFLLVVLSLLGLFSINIPEDGFSISEELTIQFGSINDLLPPDKSQYADISSIIDVEEKEIIPAIKEESVEPIKDVEIVVLNFEDSTEVDSTITDSIVDTLVAQPKPDTVRASARKLRKKTYPIAFPNDDKTILFTFFDKLKNVDKARQPLRIMHYGDSQIEGDRISAVLRQYFQENYSGMGPGFVQAYEDAGFASPVILKHTGKWEQYSRFAKKDTIVPHARYGHMTKFARFKPFDCSVDDPSDIGFGTVTISGKEQWMYPLRQSFQTIDIFLGYNRTPVYLEIHHKDSLVHMVGIQPKERVQKISWTSPTKLKECTLSFTGGDSPDIYGIALDGKNGIALDNISLRGSSGLEFTRTSKRNLQSIYSKLDVGLIILQFGVNVVPNIRKEYRYYEEKLNKQVVRLKQLFPNIPILIISVSDMSRKKGVNYESYPNIELIRDVQKRVAFTNDCAFWDMYEAMGGHNSMPSWVFAKPPLAKKDFTHFNYKGAKIIGQMLYNALMNEYASFVEMDNLEITEND